MSFSWPTFPMHARSAASSSHDRSFNAHACGLVREKNGVRRMIRDGRMPPTRGTQSEDAPACLSNQSSTDLCI